MASAYSVVLATSKPHLEAIAAVKQALTARKFSVLFELAFVDRLEAAGLPPLSHGGAVHAIEFCHAPTARIALEKNFELAYFMPCKVLVRWLPTGETEICLLRPSALTAFLPGPHDPQLVAALVGIEATIVEALTEAAGAT